MAGRRVGAGDRVAVLSRNCIAFFEILFGCAKLGAILVPLNWRMPAGELEQLVTDCAPKLLFHGPEDAGVTDRMVAPPPSIAFGAEYERLRESAPAHVRRDHCPAGVIGYLLYTSGHTRRPQWRNHPFRKH